MADALALDDLGEEFGRKDTIGQGTVPVAKETGRLFDAPAETPERPSAAEYFDPPKVAVRDKANRPRPSTVHGHNLRRSTRQRGTHADLRAAARAFWRS